MALSLFEQICNFFTPSRSPRIKGDVLPNGDTRTLGVPAPETAPVVEVPPTEIEMLQKKFDPRFDMIVISQGKYLSLTGEEMTWIDSLGNRVFYFTDNTLVNIAIVRAR